MSSVPTDPTITDQLVYMNGMILIEGEFTGKIQSTIKKLSVGMYNSNLAPDGIAIYPYYNTPNIEGKGGLPLNAQSWAIRRLK